MLSLPNIKEDYNIKEITRDKLNKQTSIRICFLKQGCNYVIPKTLLAVFKNLEFEITSFKKYKKSLLYLLNKLKAIRICRVLNTIGLSLSDLSLSLSIL